MTLRPGLLQVAAFAGFPPFVWRDGTRICGGDIRLLEEFAESQRLQLAIRFFGFEALWQRPGQGVADIAASGLSRLRHRSHSSVAWSTPYSEVRRTALLRREDETRFRHPADFRKSRFAVVPNSAADAHARRNLPAETQIIEVPSLEAGIQALQTGEVDALGTGSVSARYQMSRHSDLVALNLHTSKDAVEPIAFALRPNHRLQHTLNHFLRSRRNVQPPQHSRCTDPDWLSESGSSEISLTSAMP